MKKSLLAVGLLAAAIFAGAQVSAQTLQNGPYYANPSWDQQIPAAQRFIVLSNWGNAAVLDRETGLVWQRTPEIPTPTSRFSSAVFECYLAATGGRKGWRLPAPEEMLSLIDPTQSNPALPPGNPFQGVLISYWSTTIVFPPVSGIAGSVVRVTFDNGGVNTGSTFDVAGVWCVRGGSHVLKDLEPVP